MEETETKYEEDPKYQEPPTEGFYEEKPEKNLEQDLSHFTDKWDW